MLSSLVAYPSVSGREENSQPYPTAEFSLQSDLTKSWPEILVAQQGSSLGQSSSDRETNQLTSISCEHSQWPCITRESEQWSWEASESCLWYSPAIESSQQPYLTAKDSQCDPIQHNLWPPLDEKAQAVVLPSCKAWSPGSLICDIQGGDPAQWERAWPATSTKNEYSHKTTWSP